MQSIRYVCKSEADLWATELSYNGGIEGGKGNPSNTDVIRLLSKVNPQWPTSPWRVKWEQSLGNLIMPTGAWNGIFLTQIASSKIFFALSNIVICVSPETGEKIWEVSAGNTPIYKIMASIDTESLIVYNGYYDFKSDNGKGNISKLNFNGDLKWQAELPSEKDIYSNPPYYKNENLYSNSWEGFQCRISEESGKIIEKQFTK